MARLAVQALLRGEAPEGLAQEEMPSAEGGARRIGQRPCCSVAPQANVKLWFSGALVVV